MVTRDDRQWCQLEASQFCICTVGSSITLQVLITKVGGKFQERACYGMAHLVREAGGPP